MAREDGNYTMKGSPGLVADRGTCPSSPYVEFVVVTGYDDEDEVLFVADITRPRPVLFADLGKPHGSPTRAFAREEAAVAGIERALR